MVSNVSFNTGYNRETYMVLPLKKVRYDGMKVESSKEEVKQPESVMRNLDDLKAADTNHDNILSLSELQHFENKTEFAKGIMEMMERFAQSDAYGKM